MSPGPTFDRVYASLKEQLMSGRWAPGARLEPAVIGDDLNASITPVRDALHRLAGERLVEATRHDGFWVPSLTEAQLRGLYAWNGVLVAWALRRQRRRRAQQPALVAMPPDPGALFLDIARDADSPELEHAIAGINARLASFRALEGEVLAGIPQEIARIEECLRTNDAGQLRREFAAYHKRRQRTAPAILVARHRAFDPHHGR